MRGVTFKESMFPSDWGHNRAVIKNVVVCRFGLFKAQWAEMIVIVREDFVMVNEDFSIDGGVNT